MSEAIGQGLSVSQEAAVLDTRSEVLVAAGAGSGKTRLLVAAVVRALVEEELPLERLVAVTFTRKAGAELAARVRGALEACGRYDLARALDSAALGTIDALCRRLVKDNALAAGVDPTCTVLEPDAAGLVKKEVIAGVWEAAVEQADEAQLEVLASQGKDLCEEVVSLYDRLRGLGQDHPGVEIAAGGSEEQARSNLARTIEPALAAGAAQAKPSISLQDDLRKLVECLAWLSGPVAERGGDFGLRTSAGFFPSRRTRTMEEHFEPVRAALTRYRCALAEARLRPLLDCVNALLAEFDRRYTQRKQEHGLVDFADLGLKARMLLAGAQHEGAHHRGLPGCLLLVDEFQDTNELQCAILAGLGAARVLMVGDERQSIYRFRGADVDVFRRRRAAFGPGASVGETGGLHRLDVNYRSCVEILDFVNRLFSQESFFGSDFACLQADSARTPACAVRAHAGAGPVSRVEVLVAERRQEGDEEKHLVPMQQSEAEVLAAHTRGLLDNQGWQQRDIVVLLPTQTHVELYRDALVAEGIDVYLVRGKGYYTQEEVADVTALLSLLVNPQDDLALITVLRSPLVGMSDDGLYLLGTERRAKRMASLWEAVRSGHVAALSAEDRGALTLFLERWAKMRPRVGRPGLAGLIDDAVTSFCYDVCLLAAPEGRRRFANVRKLMRLAEEYELTSGPELSGFLSLLKSMGRLGDREGSAPTLGEGEDVVRVMTVHQAKGLEFPVVMLAGLGADAHRPETSTFAVGGDGRVGLFLKGYRHPTYESHDPYWGPAIEIAGQELSREREEDIRLLYVAMTRAQERLVLVGGRPAKGALDASRIGRIIAALGFTGFPERGQSVSVEGLCAVAVGVQPGSGEAAPGDSGRGSRDPDRGPREPGPTTRARGAGPRFVELPPASGIPSQVSFSALAAYQRCPRQFYLQRVLGLTLAVTAPRDEEGQPGAFGVGSLDDDEQSAGLNVGILVHRLLERLCVSDVRPAETSVLDAAEEALLATGVCLSPAELARAVVLTLAAWDSAVVERPSLSSALREAPFFFASGEAVVSGVMDVVCQERDCWYVVDYKTNALRGRPSADLAETYSLQRAVYCLAALRAGAPAVQMDLLFLEQPRQPVTERYGAEDISGLEARVSEAFDALSKRDFTIRAGKMCEGCEVARVCGSMARAQVMV